MTLSFFLYVKYNICNYVLRAIQCHRYDWYGNLNCGLWIYSTIIMDQYYWIFLLICKTPVIYHATQVLWLKYLESIIQIDEEISRDANLRVQVMWMKHKNCFSVICDTKVPHMLNINHLSHNYKTSNAVRDWMLRLIGLQKVRSH